MPFNEKHPEATDVNLKIMHRRNPMGILDNTTYGETVLPNCLIDHLGWSAAKGLWDDTEEDLIALNIPCLYHSDITLSTGEKLTHQDITVGCEIEVPEGAAMAGNWVVNSLPACSAQEDLGDTLRLRRKS